MHGLVTKIQKFTLHDGPGIRSTIFLKGCPLSCIWCQNPETINIYPEILFSQMNCIECKKCIEICPNQCFFEQEKIRFNSDDCDQCGLCIDNCPVGALNWSSAKRSSDDILKEIMQDKVYYDLSGGGITLSGGEPLFQIDFCQDLVLKAKTSGLHVALDTSGFATEETFESVIPLVDVCLFDIKFIDNSLHLKYTGKSNTLILKNFEKVVESETDSIVRVPLVPGITNTRNNLQQIKKYLGKYKERIKVDYIPFNNLIISKYKMLGKLCRLNVSENIEAKEIR